MEDEGLEVAEARSCAEAERLARGTTFDVAFGDQLLPDGAGSALLRDLADRTAGLRAVLLCSCRAELDVSDIPDILDKPVPIQGLLSVLRSIRGEGGHSASYCLSRL